MSLSSIRAVYRDTKLGLSECLSDRAMATSLVKDEIMKHLGVIRFIRHLGLISEDDYELQFDYFLDLYFNVS